MALELYKVSVPGSLMLMGEHAVLQGKQALVCAVNQRLEMQLTPSATKQVVISDTRLGTLTQNLSALQVQDPFKFVLKAILEFKQQIPSGFTLNISSEFSSVIGFGSSAAVTVATIAVLGKWLNIPLSQGRVFELARKVILELQGAGSGADVAASVYGGVLAYEIYKTNDCTGPTGAATGRTRSLVQSLFPTLTAIYCGYKVPTPEVIMILKKSYQEQPERFDIIFQAMHDCVLQATVAIQQADWLLLGSLFSQHHKLQAELGTSDNVLDKLAQLLENHPQIHGAKISGAGLGDCVIGLGSVSEQLVSANDGMQQFQVNIDQQGLTYANN